MQSISARRMRVVVPMVVGLVCASVALPRAGAQTSDVAAEAAPADADKLAEAKRHFQLGLNHLRDPEGERIEPAYLEFKRAYELSSSPRVLGNIGYCAMKLERYAEAVAAYREYLANVPNVDAVERAQIENDLLMMTDGASTIVVSYAQPGAYTLVDERVPVQGASIKNSYGPYDAETSLLIHPGHHVVRLVVDGQEQGSWDFNATSGQSQSHVFEPRPPEPVATPLEAEPAPASLPAVPPPAARRSYLGPVITIAAGGAMLLGGAVTGALAMKGVNDLEKRCPDDVCKDGGYKSDVDSTRTLGTVTDVLVIGGAAVAVGGTVWLLLTRANNREHAAAPRRTVTAACTTYGCRLGVSGQF